MGTFLWIWAYSLKTPISVLCAISIIACFLSWLSAKSQRGEQNLTTLHIGIVIALFWSGIYALPAPNYNIQTVVKEIPKPYPVVKKYVAQKQVLVRTITVRYTQDALFSQCINSRRDIDSERDYCTDWSKRYMQPRVVEKITKVPVYSGVQVKTVMYTRDARVRWCQANVNISLDDCTTWAKKMEAPAQIEVRMIHDPYLKLFQECNNIGAISPNDGGKDRGAETRNERIKICTDMALRGSR